MGIVNSVDFLVGLLLGSVIATVSVTAYFILVLEDIKKTNQKLSTTVKKLKEVHFRIIASLDSQK